MSKKELKFCECKDLEDFKKTFFKFHLQDLALQDGVSYFDVSTSNMDGTMIGEQFDHALRMKSFYDNNKHFFEQVNISVLMNDVYEKYQKDINKYIDKCGHSEFDKGKEFYGKYYRGLRGLKGF